MTQSQEDAYAAMAVQDTLCSPFGLDSARPTLVLSDVRAQPSKKDDGYAALETEKWSVACRARVKQVKHRTYAGMVSVRIYSTEERRLHTTCLETAKKAMENFGLFE